MGFWDTLFGGSSQQRTPGTDAYINPIRDYASSQHLGMAGRSAKNLIHSLSKGNYDSDPTVSAYLNPVRDFYNTSIEENRREGQMGAGALFGSNNPVLAKRIQDLQTSRARDEAGTKMAEMIPALYGQASATYQGAKNARDSNELSALQSALQGYLSSFYTKTKGGIIPGLAGAAVGLGGLGVKV